MTSIQRILVDLLTSPSTASAITDHTDIPTEKVTSILLEQQGLGIVETRSLAMLTIWSLTTEGREIALTFPPAPKEYS